MKVILGLMLLVSFSYPSDKFVKGEFAARTMAETYGKLVPINIDDLTAITQVSNAKNNLIFRVEISEDDEISSFSKAEKAEFYKMMKNENRKSNIANYCYNKDLRLLLDNGMAVSWHFFNKKTYKPLFDFQFSNKECD